LRRAGRFRLQSLSALDLALTWFLVSLLTVAPLVVAPAETAMSLDATGAAEAGAPAAPTASVTSPAARIPGNRFLLSSDFI
jgi:hypothetical protein